MKYVFHSTPFFTILRAVFLLVKLAFMAALTGLWHRLTKNLPLGLSHSVTSMRSGRIRLSAGFQFNVQKQPVGESSVDSVVKKPHSYTRTESHQSDRKCLGGGASASVTASKKGRCGGCHS